MPSFSPFTFLFLFISRRFSVDNKDATARFSALSGIFLDKDTVNHRERNRARYCCRR
jgi:hypothetical protein